LSIHEDNIIIIINENAQNMNIQINAYHRIAEKILLTFKSKNMTINGDNINVKTAIAHIGHTIPVNFSSIHLVEASFNHHFSTQ
jgi:hypothetical protein